MSTNIARLTSNSASGDPFETVCVAAAAIVLRYPSSESRIWFGSGSGPAYAVCCRRSSCPCGSFIAEPPIIAEPPKVFSSPYMADLARCFARKNSLKVVFHAVQVFWSSEIFYHYLVSVAYSPDCSSDFSAPACIYLSCLTSFPAWTFSVSLPLHW